MTPTAGRLREMLPDSPSHMSASDTERSRLGLGGSTAWLSVVLCLTLGGCLLFYDYGDHEPKQAGATGGEGSGGGGGSGGQSCNVEEQPGLGCQQCLDMQCGTELAACAVPVTCRSFGQCVIECCEPGCFEVCDQLTESEEKEDVQECICNWCEEACDTVIPPCPL